MPRTRIETSSSNNQGQRIHKLGLGENSRGKLPTFRPWKKTEYNPEWLERTLAIDSIDKRDVLEQEAIDLAQGNRAAQVDIESGLLFLRGPALAVGLI